MCRSQTRQLNDNFQLSSARTARRGWHSVGLNTLESITMQLAVSRSTSNVQTSVDTISIGWVQFFDWRRRQWQWLQLQLACGWSASELPAQLEATTIEPPYLSVAATRSSIGRQQWPRRRDAQPGRETRECMRQEINQLWRPAESSTVGQRHSMGNSAELSPFSLAPVGGEANSAERAERTLANGLAV